MTNPALRPVAERLPFFGVVLHQGRTTGRMYRTPVNAFPHEGGFVIALTYGDDVDWVRNVRAARGCGLIHRGRLVDLADPRVVTLDEAADAIPGWVGAILRVLGVEQALLLHAASTSRR